MLTNYIEKDIKRKCLICDFLLKNKHTNLDEIAEYMETSRVTVRSDIHALNEELDGLIVIQMKECVDNWVYQCRLQNGATERKVLYKLYDNSMFLKCVAFFCYECGGAQIHRFYGYVFYFSFACVSVEAQGRSVSSRN